MQQLKILAFSAIAAMVLLPSARAAQAEPAAFELGWLRASLSIFLHPIAVEEGFYADHDLAPNATAIRSGDGGTGAQSVLAGNLDIYLGVISDVAKLNSQAVEMGQEPPLVVLAVGAPGVTHLVLQKDIPFETVSDLQGLRIGVSSLGSAHLVTFRYFLAEQGTSVEELGLQLVRVGGSDMPAALVSDQIDGFLHSQPTPSIAAETGKAKVAIAPADMGLAGRSPNAGVIARRDWVEANREVANRFLAALHDAGRAYSELPVDRVVEIAVKYLGGEPDLIKASYPFVNPALVDLKEGADIYWSVEMAAMKDRGEVAQDFKQEEMFGFDLVDE